MDQLSLLHSGMAEVAYSLGACYSTANFGIPLKQHQDDLFQQQQQQQIQLQQQQQQQQLLLQQQQQLQLQQQQQAQAQAQASMEQLAAHFGSAVTLGESRVQAAATMETARPDVDEEVLSYFDPCCSYSSMASHMTPHGTVIKRPDLRPRCSMHWM